MDAKKGTEIDFEKVAKFKAHVFALARQIELLGGEEIENLVTGGKSLSSSGLSTLKSILPFLSRWEKAGVIKYNGKAFEEKINILKNDQAIEYEREDMMYAADDVDAFIKGVEEILNKAGFSLEESQRAGMVNEVGSFLVAIMDSIHQGCEQIKGIRGKAELVKRQHNGAERSYIGFAASLAIRNILTAVLQPRFANLMEVYNNYQSLAKSNEQTNIETFCKKFDWKREKIFGDIYDSKTEKTARILAELESVNLGKRIFSYNISPEAMDVIEDFVDNIEVQEDFVAKFVFQEPDFLNELADNKLFNKLLSAKEPCAKEEVVEVSKLICKMVSEHVGKSPIALAFNAEFEVENFNTHSIDSADMFGVNIQTSDFSNKIVLYIETIIEKIGLDEPATLLAQILNTVFHEYGHLVDRFNMKMKREGETDRLKKDSAKAGSFEKWLTLLETSSFDEKKIVALAYLSPSIREYMQKNDLTAEQLAKEINATNYDRSHEEYFAREYSDASTRSFVDLLSSFYRTDERQYKVLQLIKEASPSLSEVVYDRGKEKKNALIKILLVDAAEDLLKIDEQNPYNALVGEKNAYLDYKGVEEYDKFSRELLTTQFDAASLNEKKQIISLLTRQGAFRGLGYLNPEQRSSRDIRAAGDSQIPEKILNISKQDLVFVLNKQGNENQYHFYRYVVARACKKENGKYLKEVGSLFDKQKDVSKEFFFNIVELYDEIAAEFRAEGKKWQPMNKEKIKKVVEEILKDDSIYQGHEFYIAMDKLASIFEGDEMFVEYVKKMSDRFVEQAELFVKKEEAEVDSVAIGCNGLALPETIEIE